jgi:predicted nuclease of predicted toxin-antitoxin system
MPNLIPDEFRLLLDENISHTISSRLIEAGVDALPVAYRGMNGLGDYRVFQFAQKEQRAVATIDEYDFTKLALKTALHCGVAVIPSGRNRDERYDCIMRVVDYLRETPPAMAAIQNRIISINSEMEISSTIASAIEMPIVATSVRLKPIA